MSISTLAVALATLIAAGNTIPERERAEQEAVYQKSWNTSLVWRLDDLPRKGVVADYRVPYSGHIYPDNAGGTASALRKYDRAFHRNQLLATSHEQWDTSAYQEQAMVPQRVGLFGARTRMRPALRTPPWHGHCNGWTAAAIRHAEPQNTVVRNGVAFSPADIKALLADVYMYSDYEPLAGEYGSVNAGSLHVMLANWLGQQSHPLAMESAPGREKWNFPIYAFAASIMQRGQKSAEVQTTIRYAYYSRGEHDRSPRIERQKYFHYRLDLNAEGEIVGGSYYRDSSTLDLLWLPKPPAPCGSEGNERGNPHLDVDKVLSIWRESVPTELIGKWRNSEPDVRP